MDLEGSLIATDDLVATLRRAGCVFAEDEAALLAEVASAPDQLASFVNRRVAGEPLEYIVGFVEFCGWRWDVRPGVFIPRQRSEFLVEQAARFESDLILDLCCGCGALSRSLQRRIAGRIVGVDIAPEALASPRANNLRETYQGDLFDALPERYKGRFSIILANAPYVPTSAIADMPRESRDYERVSALDGGTDGMEIQRRILREADLWLEPDGRLLTETSAKQGVTLATYAADLGWEPELVHDPKRGAHVLVVHKPVLHRATDWARVSLDVSRTVDASKGEDMALTESDIERRLDQNENDILKLYPMVKDIQQTLKAHDRRLDRIDGRLASLETSMAEVLRRLPENQ